MLGTDGSNCATGVILGSSVTVTGSVSVTGVPGQVGDEAVRDGFLEDGTAVRGHRGGQGRVPRGWLRGSGEAYGVGVALDCGLVVRGGEEPRARVVPGDDPRGDADAWPVEVAVVAELAACLRDRGGQAVERGGRLPLGADERLGIGAKLRRRAPEHGRVLAGADEQARDGDRHRDQLVQGDVERGTV